MADKRKRRSKQEMSAIRIGLAGLVQKHAPLTIRHLFYLAVAAWLIAKTEVDYRNVVIRLAGEMREAWLDAYRAGELVDDEIRKRIADGVDDAELAELCELAHVRQHRVMVHNGEPLIPFGEEFVVDGSRWIIKPRTFNGIETALRNTAELYRRAQWDESDQYVMFICEKDAIASLVSAETRRYDVPLAIIKGMSSKTFLWETALAIDAADKDTYLYLLTDHDGAADDIVKSSVERIRRYARTDKPIHSKQLAVTPEQIAEFNLPLRPPKTDKEKASDKFGNGCVEIDALPPGELRRIVRQAIEQHIDPQALSVLEVTEANERALFERIAVNLPKIQEMLA
jgi:hypothetical protein